MSEGYPKPRYDDVGKKPLLLPGQPFIVDGEERVLPEGLVGIPIEDLTEEMLDDAKRQSKENK